MRKALQHATTGSRPASGRNARADTNTHVAARRGGRCRCPTSRKDCSGAGAPASSSRRPKARTARWPRRHRRSRSAGAGSCNRPAARACGGRARSARARICAAAEARPRREWNNARRLNASWALCCDVRRCVALFQRREQQAVVCTPYFACFLGAVQQVPMDDLYSPGYHFCDVHVRLIGTSERGLPELPWGLGKEPV